MVFYVGHLDRVVNGLVAEEILNACDDKSDYTVSQQSLNPTISIGQAIRRRNLATFLNLAEQQLKKAQDALQQQQQLEASLPPLQHPSLMRQNLGAPMLVQGFKTNARDAESHIVYFDTEALIGKNMLEIMNVIFLFIKNNIGF